MRAVDDLVFAAEPGAILRYPGGIGGGKTTTMRMMCAIIRPTSGSIEVTGAVPDHRRSDAIGFLTEARGLYGKMTMIAMIACFGQLRQMRARGARGRLMEWLARFDLAPCATARG